MCKHNPGWLRQAPLSKVTILSTTEVEMEMVTNSCMSGGQYGYIAKVPKD